jgi:hypothetical protein
MPRRSKGPRLWLRLGRRDRDGKQHGAVFVILDKGRQVATGCTADEADKAEQALAAYITQKHQRGVSHRDPTQIPVADVLSVYLRRGAETRAPGRKPPQDSPRWRLLRRQVVIQVLCALYSGFGYRHPRNRSNRGPGPISYAATIKFVHLVDVNKARRACGAKHRPELGLLSLSH